MTPKKLSFSDQDIGELLTVAEVMATLKVGRTTVYELIRTGKLETIHVNPRRQRITERSLKSFVHANIGREAQS